MDRHGKAAPDPAVPPSPEGLAAGRDRLLASARALYRAGRPADAAGLLRRVIALHPGDAEALNLLGVALDGAGDSRAGERALAEALASRETASGRCNHAMVLSHLGRYAEAEAEARRALALRPDYPEALNNLGVALDALRRPAEAETAFRRALALQPNLAGGWVNFGKALSARGRASDARAAYEQALALTPAVAPPAGPVAAGEAASSPRPATAEDAARRGHILRELTRFDEAVEACNQALALRPDHVPALTTLGAACRALGRLDEAERAERRALAIRPGDAALLNALALTLQARHRPDEALALLDLAEGVAPADPETHHHRALLLLRAGRFERGWDDYEWRMRTWQAGDSHAQFAGQPRWAGEPLHGRTLLVVPEQGLGDTIQFARYVPLIAARGGRVVLGTQTPLARLMGSLKGAEAVVAAGEALPPYDLHVPLLSVPRLFGTDGASVPGCVPYLGVEPALRDRWARRIASAGDGFKVGIVWAGNPNHLDDRQRSIGFAALAPLFGVPGPRWFSLQVGPRAGDPHAAGSVRPDRFVDLSGEIVDFAEAAAAVAALDLVICVDTVTAHLAGALGRPVWTLLSDLPDWRWLASGETSAWYPTMRLFRQARDRSWRPVVAAVAEALAATIASASARR